MMEDVFAGRQRMIPIGNLIVDHRYQRPRKERLINKIATEFDPDAFGSLTVSERIEDGMYAIYDGQQRYWGVKAMGWDDTQQLPCTVATGLSPEIEAVKFEKINEDRIRVNTFEDWASRIFRGDPDALAVQTAVQEAGFALTEKLSHNHSHELSCIATVENMWLHVGSDYLVRILRVIREGFPDDYIGGPLVHGMTMFMMEFIDDVKDGLLIGRLQKTTAGTLIRRSQTFKDGHSGSLRMYIAYILLDLYNDGQKMDNRLGNRTPAAFAITLREWVRGEQSQNKNVRKLFTKKNETNEQAAERMRIVRSRRRVERQIHLNGTANLPKDLGELHALFSKGEITKFTAKQVAQKMANYNLCTQEAVGLVDLWTK